MLRCTQQLSCTFTNILSWALSRDSDPALCGRKPHFLSMPPSVYSFCCDCGCLLTSVLSWPHMVPPSAALHDCPMPSRAVPPGKLLHVPRPGLHLDHSFCVLTFRIADFLQDFTSMLLVSSLPPLLPQLQLASIHCASKPKLLF